MLQFTSDQQLELDRIMRNFIISKLPEILESSDMLYSCVEDLITNNLDEIETVIVRYINANYDDIGKMLAKKVVDKLEV